MVTMSDAMDQAYEGRAMVAAFGDSDEAREAARRLHEEGFHKIWIGATTTSADGTHLASGQESLGEKIGRFFSGESQDRTLYDELIRHGVGESEARRLDMSLPPSSAVLTVDGHNHPELAAEIIEDNGGHIVAGESFGAYDAAVDETQTGASSLRGSDVLGYGDASEYARGERVDEQRRIQLREERLSIDKQERSLGEARITKDVVEHRQDVDVPVVREELFVERRPVAETIDDAGPITEGETIRIPLMREDVVVTKRPVVTGEVVVGKRRVTETQRVGDTTREERVQVSGPDGAVSARGYDGDDSGL